MVSPTALLCHGMMTFTRIVEISPQLLGLQPGSSKVHSVYIEQVVKIAGFFSYTKCHFDYNYTSTIKINIVKRFSKVESEFM